MISHLPKTADCKPTLAPSTTDDQLFINNNADGYTDTIINFSDSQNESMRQNKYCIAYEFSPLTVDAVQHDDD